LGAAVGASSSPAVNDLVNADPVLGSFGGAGRLVPISIAIGIFVLGYVTFRRQEPWFAERA